MQPLLGVADVEVYRTLNHDQRPGDYRGNCLATLMNLISGLVLAAALLLGFVPAPQQLGWATTTNTKRRARGEKIYVYYCTPQGSGSHSALTSPRGLRPGWCGSRRIECATGGGMFESGIRSHAVPTNTSRRRGCQHLAFYRRQLEPSNLIYILSQRRLANFPKTAA
jgi:hypothetical protein